MLGDKGAIWTDGYIVPLDPITDKAQTALCNVTKLLVIADTTTDAELRDLAKQAVKLFLYPPMVIKSGKDG